MVTVLSRISLQFCDQDFGLATRTSLTYALLDIPQALCVCKGGKVFRCWLCSGKIHSSLLNGNTYAGSWAFGTSASCTSSPLSYAGMCRLTCFLSLTPKTLTSTSTVGAANNERCSRCIGPKLESTMKVPTAACTLLVLTSLLCAQALKDFPAGEPPSQTCILHCHCRDRLFLPENLMCTVAFNLSPAVPCYLFWTRSRYQPFSYNRLLHCRHFGKEAPTGM